MKLPHHKSVTLVEGILPGTFDWGHVFEAQVCFLCLGLLGVSLLIDSHTQLSWYISFISCLFLDLQSNICVDQQLVFLVSVFIYLLFGLIFKIFIF